MSIEENKATFRRYVEEVWVKGNLDSADEIFAEKYLSLRPMLLPRSALPRT